MLYLALAAPTMRLSDVDEAAQTTVAQRLSMVSGVAQVQVFGTQKYAVRAQVDPRALAVHQIGIDEVANAIHQRQRQPSHGNAVRQLDSVHRAGHRTVA